MLSFIYQVWRGYQQTHHFRPNVLYISDTHLAVLRAELDTHPNPDKLRRYLGMEVIVRSRLLHPKVCWLPSAARKVN